ncbi:hypothetical protein L841_3069 [Mycobacterium sp. MAC_080597_8934]|nr:hypothetical protein L841_3069 [Mycobacterium sp. MAC_080597_8934]
MGGSSTRNPVDLFVVGNPRTWAGAGVSLFKAISAPPAARWHRIVAARPAGRRERLR